ncbi:MAG: Hsp20/alpha crystallin family protein, partial [Deltaproteobacteria bacterium]|nr:Hsp20/alpha crystallin family protein [Deltaproteobacteria bacterium]
MNIVHKPSNMPAVSNTAGNFDPFRTMRELMRFDPFAEMGTISNWQSIQFNPDFEVKETREGYQFRADLPGIKEKDLEISMTGNRLTVSGHREAEKRDESDRYYLYERSYGSFSRSFTLPDGVDNTKVAADL